MALSHLTDLFDRAAARIILQYRELTTRFIPDVEVLIGEVQEAEDAFWAMYEQLDLDQADGVWLERLGGIVGEAREGFPDDPGGGYALSFRNIIRARIAANKSTADSDSLIGVVQQGLSGLGLTLALVDWYPAGQALTLSDPPLLLDEANRLGRLLGRARAIAVQTMFLWQPDEDAEIFVCGDATGAITPVGKGFDDAAAPDDPTAGKLAGAVNV